MAMDYVVSIKLKPDDEVTGAVKKLLDDVGSGVTKTTEAPTKAARNFVREFRDSFQQIGSAVRGFRGELSFLQNTYSTVSGVLGVGARDIVQTAVDWNSEMETMNLSLATVLSSVDRLDGGQFSDFQNAQKEVARLFGTIVEEAAATPVEFSDIVQTFTTILPLTRKLVPDMKELVRLSASLSTWDVIGNRRRGDTALDVRQILSGQLNPRLIQNPLLSARLPELKSQFELMEKARKEGKSGLEEQAQLLRMVQQTLGMPDKARAALENSFEGMFNALKSEFKLLFTSGSSPVFEDLKNVIRGAREYLQAHPNEVRQMVREFSQFLFKAGEFLYGVFKFFYDNFETVKTVFWAFIKVWTAVNLLKFVGGLVAFAEVWKAGTLLDFVKAVAGFSGKVPLLTAATTAGTAASGAGGAAVAGVAGAGAAGFLARWLPRIAKGATGVGLVYLLLDILNDVFGPGSARLSTDETTSMAETSADWANTQGKTGEDRTRIDNKAANAMGWRTSLDALTNDASGGTLALIRAARLTENFVGLMQTMQFEQVMNRIGQRTNTDGKSPEVRVRLEIEGANATLLEQEGDGARVDVRSVGKKEN